MGVVVPMLLQLPITVDGVVVEPAVLDQPLPLIPAWWDVLASVLIQVLPIVGCPVPTGLQIGGEGLLLVVLHPVGGAAVVVVSVHMVVVHIEA